MCVCAGNLHTAMKNAVPVEQANFTVLAFYLRARGQCSPRIVQERAFWDRNPMDEAQLRDVRRVMPGRRELAW